MAEIYRIRKKFDKAIVSFDKSLAIYEVDTEKYLDKILVVLASKGTVLAFDKKKKEAKKVFAKYIALAESKPGKESEKLLPYLEKQRNFYLYIKDFDMADRISIRQNIILTNSNNSNAINELRGKTACYMYQNLGPKEAEKRQRKIFEAVRKVVGEKRKTGIQQNKEIKRITSGVVNGKAIELKKPIYSSFARAARIRGFVLVKILIDEDGNVVEAKAFCGHPILRRNTEDAAKSSKFAPTLLEGQAVEVSGMILYSFN